MSINSIQLYKCIAILLLAFVSILPCSNAQDNQTHLMSLKNCVDMAIEKSTAVLKGNNNNAAAGALILAAYGQYLPNLVAGAGYNFDHGNNFYGSAGATLVNENRSAYNYQLTSTVNIFSGYANYASLKAAKIGEQIANLTLERAKEQIALDITQTYLQIILDKKIVALDSSNLAVSLKREDQLKVLNDIGRKAKTDLYQQQAQTSSDKLLLMNAQTRMRNDKIILFQKLRIYDADAYDIEDMTIDDNPEAGYYDNKAALTNEAINTRADLKAAILTTDYNDWLVKKYKSGTIPRVSAFAGIYNNGAYFNSLHVNNAEAMPVSQHSIPYQLVNYTYGLIGINASWNIFDQYYTRSNVTIAKLAADNARIDAEDTKISINATLQQACNEYKNALQQIATTNTGLQAAQLAYDAVNGKYMEGATDYISEISAQQVLLTAAENKIQASLNLMLQKRAIDYIVGKGVK